MTELAVVIPLKSFSIAKDRLRRAGALDVTFLARELALGVVRSCAPLPVIVLSESDEVRDFAIAENVEVLESDSNGLNEAVQLAYASLSTRFHQLMIVHGDLRQPQGLGEFEPGPGVTIVTDHHGVGTNVLVVPTGLDFRFHYGPSSRLLHESEARRLGIRLEVITQSPWAYDVDEPSDLELP